MLECQVSKGLQFRIQRYEDATYGVVIFQLSGPFTARYMYGSISPDALHNILESMSDNAEAPVHIFDLAQVPYMDSVGLGVIVDHYLQSHRKGIRVMATGVSPRVLRRFKACRMEKLFLMSASA